MNGSRSADAVYAGTVSDSASGACGPRPAPLSTLASTPVRVWSVSSTAPSGLAMGTFSMAGWTGDPGLNHPRGLIGPATNTTTNTPSSPMTSHRSAWAFFAGSIGGGSPALRARTRAQRGQMEGAEHHGHGGGLGGVRGDVDSIHADEPPGALHPVEERA